MFNLDQAVVDWRKQMQTAGINTSMPLDELEAHLREDVDRLVRTGLTKETAFKVATRHLGQPQTLKTEFKKNELLAGKEPGLAAMVFGVAMILRVLYVHYHTGPVWKGDQIGWILCCGIVLFWAANNVFWNFNLGSAREVRIWKLAAITYSFIAVWISVVPVVRVVTLPIFNKDFSTADRMLTLAAIAISFLSVFIWRRCWRMLPRVASRGARTFLGITACLTGPAALASLFYFSAPRLGHVPAPLFCVLISWAWTAIAMLAGCGYGLAEAAAAETEVEKYV